MPRRRAHSIKALATPACGERAFAMAVPTSTSTRTPALPCVLRPRRSAKSPTSAWAIPASCRSGSANRTSNASVYPGCGRIARLDAGETFHTQNFGIPSCARRSPPLPPPARRRSAAAAKIRRRRRRACWRTTPSVQALIDPATAPPPSRRLAEPDRIPRFWARDVVRLAVLWRRRLDSRRSPAARRADARHARGDDRPAVQSDAGR